MGEVGFCVYVCSQTCVCVIFPEIIVSIGTEGFYPFGLFFHLMSFFVLFCMIQLSSSPTVAAGMDRYSDCTLLLICGVQVTEIVLISLQGLLWQS